MPEDTEQPASNFLLKALYNTLAGIGGLSFLFGRRLLAELKHMDRLLGEMIGIGVAVLCIALAAMVKSASGE
ncbi:hypothetical protein [Occallatibacter riparius]|uniref:Uncharacterized protein n=1 Tax=Occallatibacter riparius TaxID=1002689 RepID=A0A9J7BT70_9BACT|nr:hypothetical protein [Occallatibacter riparius]UWZ84946.1 hypothetical protein MOP44_03160 [Occallatibacter riparius]